VILFYIVFILKKTAPGPAISCGVTGCGSPGGVTGAGYHMGCAGMIGLCQGQGPSGPSIGGGAIGGITTHSVVLNIKKC